MSDLGSRRRWFQFRLPTLFLVVTAAACLAGLIARDWKLVCERREILNAAPKGVMVSIHPNAFVMLSRLRVAMGDEAAPYIWIDAAIVPEDWDARFEAAFPEALFFERYETWLDRQGPELKGNEPPDDWPIPPTADNKKPPRRHAVALTPAKQS